MRIGTAGTEFYVPQSLADALSALESDGSVLLAGGTALTQALKQRLLAPSRLVFIGRMAELSGIEVDPSGDIVIGAMTTIREVAESQIIRNQVPVLASAARAVGNPRVRAVATIGGALMHADPRQDVLPALIAANAQALISGPGGHRDVSVGAGFFVGFMQTSISRREIVTHIRIPESRSLAERYIRFTPGSRDDYPTIAVAGRACADLEEHLVHLRLALAGAGPTPIGFSFPGLELSRPGSELSALDSILELVSTGVDPVDDAQGPAIYKRAIAQVLTRRLVSEMSAALSQASA